MKRLIISLIFLLAIGVSGVFAQEDLTVHDRFTNAILHVNHLQTLLGMNIEQMNGMLDPLGYQYVDLERYQVWFLNGNNEFEGEPELILHYDPETEILRYFSSDASLFAYVLRDLSAFGYKKADDGTWRNETFSIAEGQASFDFDETGTPETYQYLSIFNHKAAEERKKLYAEKLQAFALGVDSLWQYANKINDTARTYYHKMSSKINDINADVELADRYHGQKNYSKARESYNSALSKYNNLLTHEIGEARSFINRHYSKFEDWGNTLFERSEPLKFRDLGEDYHPFIAVVDTLESYYHLFDKDTIGMDINAKIKANDCDDIYENYHQLYSSKGEVEQLYDQKGYERLKKEAEGELRNYAENRSKYYQQNAELLKFLNISKSSFEEMYDRLGWGILEHRLANSRDSILLCAIRQSPSLEKANISKSRKLKIDKKYRTVLKKSEVNLDDYRYQDTYARIIDIVLSGNEKARKEYQTNGHYFSNKTAFYNSYISSNYNSQLQYFKRQEKAKKEAEARAREQARRQAEQQEKARQEQLRRQRAASRRSAHRTAYPPIETFAFGMNVGYGLAFVGDFGFDLHLGLSTMFPTQRRVSWGIGATAGVRGSDLDLYLTAGPQFYHGQSNQWQFLWGLYGGMDFGGGPMGTVRIGTRYRAFFFYGDIDIAPASDCQASLKMGFGLSFGH